MLEVLRTSTGQLVLAFAALAILISVGVWVVLKFRDGNDGTDEIENASDLLTKFREMRQEGHIDAEEYRTIKTDLEGKLSQQASDGDFDPSAAD